MLHHVCNQSVNSSQFNYSLQFSNKANASCHHWIIHIYDGIRMESSAYCHADIECFARLNTVNYALSKNKCRKFVHINASGLYLNKSLYLNESLPERESQDVSSS